MIVYLGGTFPKHSKRAFDLCVEHHSKISAKLQGYGYKIITPLRGKGGSEGYEPNEIVHRDEFDLDRADIMICLMVEPSIGSSMEIYRAREISQIPVIVVTNNPEVSNHYWIQAKATKVVKTINEAIDFLSWLE